MKQAFPSLRHELKDLPRELRKVGVRQEIAKMNGGTFDSPKIERKRIGEKIDPSFFGARNF